MKLAFIGEAAPAFIESGQVTASQSNPEEFNQAMTAVLALLKTPLPNAAPVNNNNSTEFARGGFKRVPLPVIGPEATVSEKRAVRPQELEQLDDEVTAGPVGSAYKLTVDTDWSKYLPGQVQAPARVVAAEPEVHAVQLETSPVQSNIIVSMQESRVNSSAFTESLPLENDYEPTQPQVVPALTSPRVNDLTNARETNAPLMTAEQKQVPEIGPKSGTEGEPYSEAMLNQVAAFASADKTVNSATAANSLNAIFSQSNREPDIAPGQVYNAGTAAETTGPVNTTVTGAAVFEAAPAVGDAPGFEAGRTAAPTARAETAAAAPDQLLEAVLPDSLPVTGRVVTSQESADVPAGETRTSSEAAVKSAGNEHAGALAGKGESTAAAAAVENEADKTGVESGSKVVNSRPTEAADWTKAATVTRETETPPLRAEQNQVPASGPKSGIVGEFSIPLVPQSTKETVLDPGVVALASARGPVKPGGQEVSLYAGTENQATASNNQTPLFDHGVRETGVAPGQVYNAGTAAETTGPVNTTVTGAAVFEAAPAVGDAPGFEAGRTAAPTARAETAAAAPDQLLEAVLPDSLPVTGRVVTSQESADVPAGETRTSSEAAVKSAGNEHAGALAGKGESTAAAAAVENEADKTGVESGSKVVNSRPTEAADWTKAATVTRETETPPLRAEQNQVPASGPKSEIVGEPGSGALSNQTVSVAGTVKNSAATGSAPKTLTTTGQEVALPAGTAKPDVDVPESAPVYAKADRETVVTSGVKITGSAPKTLTTTGQEVALPAGTAKPDVDVPESAPVYAKAVRETAFAPGQGYNAGTAAQVTTLPEYTSFARLGKPVMAQRKDPTVFEAAPAVGTTPAFDDGSRSLTTTRAETAAAAPDQVLKAVPPDSPKAAGRVVAGQEPATIPAGEARTSGEAVKSTVKEGVVFTAKVENPAADTEAVITGGKGAGGAVENTTPNNVSQYDSVSSMSNYVDNQKTVKLADMRDTLVQEIKRAYYQQKSEPLTQVDLKLEPEHLGKLTIKLFFNGGELNAHFYAGNDYVKDVLEGSIQQLRQTLDQQDLKLNQAFVFVGDDGRNGTGQSESGGRQPARYSGAYSGHTYGDIAPEPAVYEPSGHSYKKVNYLI